MNGYALTDNKDHGDDVGDINQKFTHISRRILEVFNSDDAEKKRLGELEREIVNLFKEKVEEHLGGKEYYKSWHKDDIKKITPENKEMYKRELSSHMEKIKDTAIRVQMKVIHDVYDIPLVEKEDYTESSEIWADAFRSHKEGKEPSEKQKGPKRSARDDRDDFDKLFVKDIIKQLDSAGIKILSPTGASVEGL